MIHRCTTVRVACAPGLFSLALACACAASTSTPAGGSLPQVDTRSDCSQPGAACGDGVPALDPEILFAAGPHDVGYRELELTYRPPATDRDRTLVVSVWYPAASGSGTPAAEYSLAGLAVAKGRALAAPPVAGDGRFPVAIYSHGSGGLAQIGYPYGELFASHGWILAAPSHAGNTTLDRPQDPFARILLNRPFDITAVIDGLETGLGQPELDKRADTSRVFVLGHSLGGYTALAAAGADMDVKRLRASCRGTSCEALADPQVVAAFGAGFGDPRVVAIAPQAPGFTLELGAGELTGVEVPVMLQTGRLDLITTQAEESEPLWSALDGPHDLWVEMPRGAHLSFIMLCDDFPEPLLKKILPGAYKDGCGPDFTPVARAVPALGAYALAFARRHLLGETAWDGPLRGPAWRPELAISVARKPGS